MTLLRSDPREAVLALFNVSAAAVEAVVPPPPVGRPAPEGSACWSKLLEAGAPEFGGNGEALSHVLAAGDTLSLGPWEFCAYHCTDSWGDR